jgi:hypothetical protein
MCTQHPAYPKLLNFGKEAVPFILKRLQSGDHSFRWSCLLHELTGETPDYEPEVEGEIVKFNVVAAANAWLKWGTAEVHPSRLKGIRPLFEFEVSPELWANTTLDSLIVGFF